MRWRSFHNGFPLALCVALACLLTTACGTGIELTEHVGEKDVRKAIEHAGANQSRVTLKAFVDSVPAWHQGKLFRVVDNQARLLFARSRDFDIDTVPLAGHTLSFQGYDTGDIYDNRNTVNLIFKDIDGGKTYVYRTGKTIDEFSSGFSIPMLVDMDMVNHIARQVAGNDYYIRTPIWYDRQSEQMRDGRHFIKVHIDSVLPGNAVMPLRVLFTTIDNNERAMVWVSDNVSTMRGRDFDALFDAVDPHLFYTTISDDNWERITRAQVVEGMTKEECRLALGNPKHINESADQSGLREYWYYDGGAYLFFVNGLLRQFRK